jgi:transcriptional regulator with XRE-family HTH domain
MTLGKRIRKGREVLGLTQQELAGMLGFTSQHLSAIEQDKRTPSLDSLIKISKELGVNIDFLLAGKNQNECVVTGIIPAIKADRKLTNKTKKILISVVEAFYEANPPK